MTRGAESTRDTRDLASYSVREAALYLRLADSTVRAWALGNRYRTQAGERVARPLIVPARRAPLSLSFFNLVELFVLASLRRKHEIAMPRVRKALDYVKREMGTARPLIEEQFHTDGVNLFVEEYSRLINVSEAGQVAMRTVLTGCLKRIERDPQGLVVRLFPYLREPSEQRFVEVNPRRAFGRLVIAGTGIPTEILAERFVAGDTIGALAQDYRLRPEQIEWALRFEQGAKAA